MADETPDRDPEIRRRAAWLLGMLALVAALFVTLMVTFFNTSGGDSGPDLADPTGIAPSASGTPLPSGTAAPSTTSTPTDSQPSDSTSESPSDGDGSTPAAGGTASCPSDKACALDSDIGNAVAAINAYRTQEGKSAVPGAVSDDAKQCALARGSGCKGGWAETEVPAKDGKVDGAAAVDKIKQFAKLLTDMKSIEVGWAYDPGSKTLYFATIRKD